MSDTVDTEVDTEKYQGRTPGYWSVTSIRDGSIPWNTADEELCADAPLLLAEVKRLRRLNNYLWEHRSSHWSADDDAEMNRLEMIE